MNDYVVTSFSYNGKNLTAAAFYEDGVLEELQVENASAHSRVGTIFSGSVDSVSKSIGGAFINIGNAGKQVNAGVLKEHSDSGMADRIFLPYKKGRNLQTAERVLIQITKDASGRKEAVATEHISLAGQYLVLGSRPGPVTFSKKLTAEQRKIIAKWLEVSAETSDHNASEPDAQIPDRTFPKTDIEIPASPEKKQKVPARTYHILVRTNAARAKKQDFLNELAALRHEMDRILERFEVSKKPEMLWEPEPFYMVMERDLYKVPERFLTDIPILSERDARYEYCPQVGRDLPLSERFDLRRSLDRLTQRTVYLKSGAFLVIEKTEAFVSVDVNTGSCEKGRIPEETYRRVNLEAAAALAREIRLRNLSGMILADFINLKREEHREELLNTMKKLVKRDHVHTDVIDLTPLGIMEIVREKSRRPLLEILTD